MLYVLKHKDDDVLEFDIDYAQKDLKLKFESRPEETYKLDIVSTMKLDLLPVPMNEKFDRTDLNSQKNKRLLLNWLDSRQVPKERAHSKKLREMYQFDLIDFLSKSYGLSILDVNWVVEKSKLLEDKKSYTWDLLNLYDNPVVSEKELQIALTGTYDSLYSIQDEYQTYMDTKRLTAALQKRSNKSL